jgi:hypothetical protein
MMRGGKRDKEGGLGAEARESILFILQSVIMTHLLAKAVSSTEDG